MEKRLTQLISIIFHPIIMPVAGLIIISNSGIYASVIEPSLRNYLYFVFFAFTVLLPLALVPLYYYTGLVKNINMSVRNERLVPFYISLILYFAAYLLIKSLPLSSIYGKFMLSACTTLSLVFIVSIFWKISAHMAGVGGITGLLAVLSYIFNADMMFFLITLIIVAGLTGYARLQEGSHSPLQVYIGFLAGFLTVPVIFLI